MDAHRRNRRSPARTTKNEDTWAKFERAIEPILSENPRAVPLVRHVFQMICQGTKVNAKEFKKFEKDLHAIALQNPGIVPVLQRVLDSVQLALRRI